MPNRFRQFSRSFLSVLFVFGLAGCTENRAYRDLDSRPWHAPSPPVVQGVQLPQYEPYQKEATTPHPYHLSYVEFDEQGDYWDRRQLGWTVQAIKRAAHEKDVVLVVFVHGWQNDSSELRGHDVAKFHCLLERLASAEGESRQFFGVYLSWRGKSVPGGDGWFKEKSPLDLLAKAAFLVPHELSFYDRKTAANRVAGLPMTEAIFESVGAARKGARESGHRARTIVIGHSFGALVVENAVAQALAAEVITSTTGGEGTFAAPADFIVLLNSAGESIYAKEMIDLLRRRHPSNHERPGDEISARRPLMVAVTSKADWATGGIFPVGTTLGTANAKVRRYEWDTLYGADNHDVDQRTYLTTTAGHNPLLISHRALPEGAPALPKLGADECGPAMLEAFRRNLQEPLTGPNGKVRFVTSTSEGASTYWNLEPTGSYKDQTPYWIVNVPKEIMRDHGDIFNENSLALLARLFRLSNPEEGPGLTLSSQPRKMRLGEPVGSGPGR